MQVGGWGQMGVFEVIWGQITKITTIYQNEALGSVITKKWFSRPAKVTRPQVGGIWGHLGSKSKHFQTKINNIPK